MLLVDLYPALLEKGRSPISVKLPHGERSGHFLEVRRVDTFGDLVENHASDLVALFSMGEYVRLTTIARVRRYTTAA